MTMHADQLQISVETVRRLIVDQFPQWAALPVRAVISTGTVNALFRIGDHLTGRFPLQRIEVAEARRWLTEEAGAARELAGRTAYATPEPVAIGEPGCGYLLPWSVQTWVPGTPAFDEDASDSVAFAHDLAAFVQGVRSIQTRGRTFDRAGRGGDLHNHDAWMAECFERSAGLLDVSRLRGIWATLRDLPRTSPDVMTHGDLRDHDAWMEECFQRSLHLLDVPRLRRIWATLRDLPRTSPDVMTHGDLTPGNVLVAGGRLAGVIDVGGLGPADPALDLVAAWHLLDDGPRAVLREDLGSDDLEWARGQAWAFEQAMGVVWYYVESNPAMHRMGRTTLRRILAHKV